MKGIIISTASLLLSISAYSQTQSISTITLKNGIIIEGVVEYVDVNDGVVMLVGGAKTTIPMTNIQSIEQKQSQTEKQIIAIDARSALNYLKNK